MGFFDSAYHDRFQYTRIGRFFKKYTPFRAGTPLGPPLKPVLPPDRDPSSAPQGGKEQKFRYRTVEVPPKAVPGDAQRRAAARAAEGAGGGSGGNSGVGMEVTGNGLSPGSEMDIWAQKQAEVQAAENTSQVTAADIKDDILSSVQTILIENMRTLISDHSVARNPVRDLRNPGLVGTDADLISYSGNPDTLSSTLLSPPDGHSFVHATPAQLSMLEPLLRFYVVDQDGGQREVYFSDYTTEKRLLKLSSLRRSNGVDEVFNPASEVGANVGIQNFSWEYHNKHEGDKIVQASLDLYFGSLSELVNLNYLQFLFTNGLKNPAAPPMANMQGGKEIPNTSVQQRIHAYKKEIKDKIKFMQPKGPAPMAEESMDKRIKEDFRQLKVAVGWSLPKG